MHWRRHRREERLRYAGRCVVQQLEPCLEAGSCEEGPHSRLPNRRRQPNPTALAHASGSSSPKSARRGSVVRNERKASPSARPEANTVLRAGLSTRSTSARGSRSAIVSRRSAVGVAGPASGRARGSSRRGGRGAGTGGDGGSQPPMTDRPVFVMPPAAARRSPFPEPGGRNRRSRRDPRPTAPLREHEARFRCPVLPMEGRHSGSRASLRGACASSACVP